MSQSDRAIDPTRLGRKSRVLGVAIGFVILWLLLSGMYEAWFLVLGGISVAITVFVALRMQVFDHEGAPLHLFGHGWRYWIWLAWEIAKADWYVAKYVLRPLSALSPTLFSAPATQRTELGQAIYANSITLTPGTVTVDIEPGTVIVHAITREAADGVLSGDMDRRARSME